MGQELRHAVGEATADNVLCIIHPRRWRSGRDGSVAINFSLVQVLSLGSVPVARQRYLDPKNFSYFFEVASLAAIWRATVTLRGRDHIIASILLCRLRVAWFYVTFQITNVGCSSHSRNRFSITYLCNEAFTFISELCAEWRRNTFRKWIVQSFRLVTGK